MCSAHIHSTPDNELKIAIKASDKILVINTLTINAFLVTILLLDKISSFKKFSVSFLITSDHEGPLRII